MNTSTINSTILAKLQTIKSSFVGLTTETIPKMQVKLTKEQFGMHPNDFGKLVKKSEYVGLIGTKIDYKMLVNNKLLKEADLKGLETPEEFVTKPRAWGQRVNGVLLTHTNKDGVYKEYITVHRVAANKPKVVYELDGKVCDAEMVEKIKKCFGKSTSRQGLDKPVIPNDYEVKNIKAIRVGGAEILQD